MQSRWVEHRGVRILYVDFSGFGGDVDALKAEIWSVSTVMERQPEGSVLGLADIRGTVLSREVAGRLKETASRVGRCAKKTAVVLDKVTGFKRVIMDAVGRVSGRRLILFEDIDEAKDWLVSGG